RTDLPAALRAQALEMLGHWASPSGRDAVMGLWRPIAPRPGGPAAEAIRPKFAAIMAGSPDSIRTAALDPAAGLGGKEAGTDLTRPAPEGERAAATGAGALKARETRRAPRGAEAARRAVALSGSRTRAEALRVLADVDPAAAIPMVQERIDRGSTADR